MKTNIATLFLCGSLCLGLTACDDFLTESPSVSIPDSEAFQKASDFTNNLHGMYYAMESSRFLGRDALILGDACADLVNHSNSTGHWRQLAHWQVYDTDGYLQDIWQYGYQVIDRAARIIANAEQISKLPASEQPKVNEVVAEAYAARALAMSYMVQIWGLPYSEANAGKPGIVNVTTPVGEGEKVSRATVGENYKQILSDIEQAKSYFAKEDVEPAGAFYMNPAAVDALEARVRLNMHDYAGALTAAQRAMDAFDGELIDNAADFEARWRSSNESSEDLFIIRQSATDNLGASSIHTMYNNYGLSINADFLATYGEDDIRTEVMNMSAGKFIGTNEGANANSIPILTLPELYLIIAEAEAVQGHYAAAKEALATLLTARYTDFDATSLPTDASLVTRIRMERNKELIQQGFRWYDARRWGEKISVSAGAYKDFDIAKFCYPIPANEINSGYGVTQTENWSATMPQ